MDRQFTISSDYSFDEIIDRENTRAIKFDYRERYQMPEDVLPLWVADMDFKAPPCVSAALAERAVHGIYGYSDITSDYTETVLAWQKKRFAYEPSSDSLFVSPGVVFALYRAITALTQKGEAVMIQRPVYYPFSSAILDQGRKLVNSPLVNQNGHYEMDFADIEKKVIEEGVKVFILCNPHNPVGRVWTKQELSQLGEIMLKHKVWVISDEIHQDFIFPGHKHQVFAALSPELAQITITCTAPSKTFNLAGLQISNLFIENPELKKLFRQSMKESGYSQPNLMGLIACQAAYEHGEPWLTDLCKYLEGNVTFFQNALAQKLPQVKCIQPEGTYLLWADFSALGEEKILKEKLAQEAKIWLDHGSMFGPEGTGYQRFNIASPRSLIAEAVKRLEKIS